MKKIFFVLPFVLAMSVSVASAQVVIVEEVPGDGCSMMLSGPCAPSPAPAPVVVRPRVVHPRYAPPPVVETPTVPPPPAGIPRQVPSAWFSRVGINFIYLATGDNEGDLLGGGISGEYMFSRHLGVEGSILGMGSSDDDPYAPYRDGVRAGLSLLWFPNGMKTDGLSFYLRGGVVGESISTYVDGYSTTDPIETRDTSYREVAAGLRYYIPLVHNFYALSVGIEASALFDSSNEREDGEDRSTALRLTMGFHF